MWEEGSLFFFNAMNISPPFSYNSEMWSKFLSAWIYHLYLHFLSPFVISWGEKTGPGSAATLAASLLTLEIVTRVHERSLSPESYTAANPIITDLQKGLLLSAVLHVPEKGHLVIKRVDLYFHLGWRLKCFWFQSCLASFLPYFTLLAASHRRKRNISWAASPCQAL